MTLLDHTNMIRTHKIQIRPAATAAEIDDIRKLFREYENFLEVDLCFQSFEEELAGLPGKYAPPGGTLLMADDNGKMAGCVAVRELAPGICEMKRLYVRPTARGTGLGRQLALAIIDAARALGYTAMRLDTLKKLEAALRLYHSLGFKEIPPYYANPLDGVVYLGLDLT